MKVMNASTDKVCSRWPWSTALSAYRCSNILAVSFSSYPSSWLTTNRLTEVYIPVQQYVDLMWVIPLWVM